MLARENRVVLPADFRSAVRRGRRLGSSSAIVYVVDHHSTSPTRFGFIVAKTVGNAVKRNRVRRRLRAIGREMLSDLGTGKDIVIRALSGSPEVDWVTLHEEITETIHRGVTTR